MGDASVAAKGRRRAMGGRAIPLTAGTMMVALGIVYGDLLTSPVYTFPALLAGQGGLAAADEGFVVGVLSLVFWTLMLLATVKYVLVAMRADNKGEGGILALYSLVRRHGAWLMVPGMLGTAAFLADGVFTPAVSITSALEGLRTIPELSWLSGQTVMITGVAVILLLFVLQRNGTNGIGRLFGPVMLAWCLFIAVMGAPHAVAHPELLAALDPSRALVFLFSSHNAAGFAVLGSVFLCVTGVEALYSDIGHAGVKPIHATYPFVLVCVLVSYAGQAGWVLDHAGESSWPDVVNPFFELMPQQVRPFAVVFAVAAGIIASQALITGSFTIVNEAIALNWMPHLKVLYPGSAKGQVYIPTVNWALCACTTSAVLLFRDSHHMEGAYGLALSVAMVMTTILLAVYILHWPGLGEWARRAGAAGMIIVFGVICTAFMASSLMKFLNGGWFSAVIALAVLGVMIAWDEGTRVERRSRRRVRITDLEPDIKRLAKDTRVQPVAGNLVYLTPDMGVDRVDSDIARSIFGGRPKRAYAYWVVTVLISDNPYGREWSAKPYADGRLVRVRIRLGYKEPQVMRPMLRVIMRSLLANREIPRQRNAYPGWCGETPDIAPTKYVLIKKALSPESEVRFIERFAIRVKYAIRGIAGNPLSWYGLTFNEPIVETMPIRTKERPAPEMKRVKFRGQTIPCHETNGKRKTDNKTKGATDKTKTARKGKPATTGATAANGTTPATAATGQEHTDATQTMSATPTPTTVTATTVEETAGATGTGTAAGTGTPHTTPDDEPGTTAPDHRDDQPKGRSNGPDTNEATGNSEDAGTGTGTSADAGDNTTGRADGADGRRGRYDESLSRLVAKTTDDIANGRIDTDDDDEYVTAMMPITEQPEHDTTIVMRPIRIAPDGKATIATKPDDRQADGK